MRAQLLSRHAVYLLALLLCSIPGYGYYYRQYTTSNYLISNNVYSALQDSKGYLWFFTDKGVSSFDGNTFRNFTVFDGLGDHEITGGYEDKMGRIWLYAQNGNLCYIQNDVVYNAKNNPLLARIPSIQYVRSMCSGADTSLYIGYKHGEIIRLAISGYTSISNKIDYDNALNTLRVAHDTLVADKLSSKELYVKGQGMRLWARMPTGNSYYCDGYCITADSVGVQLKKGTTVLWGEKGALNRNSVLYAWYDGIAHLFCATGKGLVIINTRSGKRDVLFENIRITGMVRDIYNNYWVTTYGNGVYFLDKNLDNIKSLALNENSKVFTPDNGQLFFTDGRSLNCFIHNDSSIVMSLKDIQANNFEPLYCDRETFFFNNSGTSYRQDRLTHRNYLIEGDVLYVHPLTHNTYLLTGPNYIEEVVVVGSRQVAIRNTPIPYVQKVCFDRLHNLYFSVRNVLYAYRVDAGTISKIYSLDNFESIEDLYMARNKLMVITNDKKIITINPNINYRSKVTQEQSFVTYNVRAIASRAAKYQFLAHTNKGSYIGTDPEDPGQSFEKLEYPVKEPELLASYAVGQYLICNINGGYYMLHDSLLNKEIRKTRLYINSVVANGRKFVNTGHVDIEHSIEAHVYIRLNGLKFNGNNNYYGYRIINRDTSRWYNSSSPNLDLLLRNGSYIIEARAFSANHIPSEPQYLYVTIQPPFYVTYWFFGCVLSFLLACGYVAIRIYHRHRKRVFADELDYLQLEHKAINSLLNPHFIFNAINNIQSLINANSPDYANRYLVILSKLIRQNIENLQFNFIPVSSELNLIRNYILLQNLRFENKIGLEISMRSKKIDKIQIPPLLIHTFVENSVVHGFSKDNPAFVIKIELDLSVDNYLIVRITDNGTGYHEHAASQSVVSNKISLGIEFIRKRLARLSDFYKVGHTLKVSRVDDNGKTGTEVLLVIYAKFDNQIGITRANINQL